MKDVNYDVPVVLQDSRLRLLDNFSIDLTEEEVIKEITFYEYGYY